MGLWAFTCTRHVTHQLHYQISWIEPGSMERSLVTLLRVYVRHQVPKCKRVTLSVMMRQMDNFPKTSPLINRWAPPWQNSAVGACKVWTKAHQNTQTEPGTHNLQLTAKSVVFNIMMKLVEAIHQENIRFIFLLVVFLLTRQISNSKNLERFMNIIHITGTFHQMFFIYALHKRFKCSGLNDILVTAGIVVQGSVDQTLRDRHYWHGVCCILLWRDILIQKRLSQFLQNEDLPAAAQHSLDIVHNALTATQVTLPEAISCLEYDVFIRHLITKVYEKPDKDMGDC